MNGKRKIVFEKKERLNKNEIRISDKKLFILNSGKLKMKKEKKKKYTENENI